MYCIIKKKNLLFLALETNNIEEILNKFDRLDLFTYLRNKGINNSEDLRSKIHIIINDEVICLFSLNFLFLKYSKIFIIFLIIKGR